MNSNKIAINGFFGRMGQAIYNQSKRDGYKVTVGIDKDTEGLSGEIEDVVLSSAEKNR